MKTLNLLLALTFSVFTLSMQAQTKKVTTQSQTNVSNGQSDYMSVDFENKIKSYLVSGEIPASLPKYVKGTSEEDYKKTLKDWGKVNINLIKLEHQKKVLGKDRKSTSRTK